MITKKKILEEIKKIKDPELNISIVDMGLVYDVKIKKEAIEVVMTLTTPFCPLSNFIINKVEQRLKKTFPSKKANVKLVFDPPWTPDKMKTRLRKKLGI